MKSKILVAIAAIILPSVAFAQKAINKTLPVQSGQHISMFFDFPKLIKVTTWDKNEISIQGTVSINNGENDDAFELITSTSGNTITVKNEIKNRESLPQRYTVVNGTEKIVFRNRAEFEKYKSEHGGGFDMVSSGVDMEIFLEIKVPRSVQTEIGSKFGLVEVLNFNGPLKVDATHGGVDVALSERSTGEVTAETKFGEIYTNLDAKFGTDRKTSGDFHTLVSAKPGTGPSYSLESKFGNVYIRKAK